MISWSKQLFDNIVINLNTDGTGEEIVPSSLEFSFQAPNEYIMNCSQIFTRTKHNFHFHVVFLFIGYMPSMSMSR